MLKRTLLALSLLACLASLCSAQKITPEMQKASERVLGKLRKLQVYNQILPVLIEPDQAKAFLPLLEKHRAAADKIEVQEHNLLMTLEKELDDPLKKAGQDGKTPDPELVNRILAHFKAFSLIRKALIDESAAELAQLMRSKLNAGQVSAAAKAFSPSVFGMDVDPETITEDMRLAYWIKMVLLDNEAYPIMVELSKKSDTREPGTLIGPLSF